MGSLSCGYYTSEQQQPRTGGFACNTRRCLCACLGLAMVEEERKREKRERETLPPYEVTLYLDGTYFVHEGTLRG